MKTTFDHRGYSLDCTPSKTASDTFMAALTVTKHGCHPEKTFPSIAEFPDEARAIAHAKAFGEMWIDRQG